MSERTCDACGVPLVRRDGEFPSVFKLRTTCGAACANVRRARPRLDTGRKVCPVCGAGLGRRDDEATPNFRRRRDDEATPNFRRRRTCSARCAYELKARKLRICPDAKACTRCGAGFGRGAGERMVVFRARRTCSSECRDQLERTGRQ